MSEQHSNIKPVDSSKKFYSRAGSFGRIVVSIAFFGSLTYAFFCNPINPIVSKYEKMVEHSNEIHRSLIDNEYVRWTPRGVECINLRESTGQNKVYELCDTDEPLMARHLEIKAVHGGLDF